MMNDKRRVVELTLGKSTKNTVVYADDSDDAPIPSLYVKKEHLPQVPPQKLTVILEWE